jgi:hypothetical protein
MKQQLAILAEAKKQRSPLTPEQQQRFNAKMASSSGIELPYEDVVEEEDKDRGYT